jgi:hypothetical protein
MNDPRPRHTGISPSDGSSRRLPSGAFGMPAGNAILATFVAIAMVAVGSWLGVMDEGQGGDASSFDALAVDGTTTTEPGASTSVVAAGSTDETGSTDSSDLADDADPAGATDPPATAAATTAASVPATTTPDAGRTPTEDDPLRLYIAGDSDAGNLGPPLQRELEQTGLVDSTLEYKVSTGLTRPDFFDWPAKLQSDVARLNPDTVVVTFGGNDAQDMLLDGRSQPVDSEAWRTEYARRVGAVMDFLSADGRTLIWVGIPNAKSGDFRNRLEILEQVTRAEADKRPQVKYVDVWNLFVGRSGGYADFIIDPRDNQGKLVRADDGFHLNQTGADILALTVAEAVRADMVARGATL